jgi:Fe-S-cluster containining protein
MIFIDNVLVSEELTTERFVCNLNACKGACCWEGDYGAPVTEKEIFEIQQYNEVISAFINEDSKSTMAGTNGFQYYEEAQSHGTALNEDGSCVYLIKDTKGIGVCTIEKVYNEGLIPVNKPISCHLYPIRITKNETIGFEAWNYDEWDVCSAACSLGSELNVPVYKFLESAIVRYKGQEFFNALESSVNNHLNPIDNE